MFVRTPCRGRRKRRARRLGAEHGRSIPHFEPLEQRRVLSLTVELVSEVGPLERTAAVGDTLFYSGQDATHGQELWKSDGTSAGTMLVKDILAGNGSSIPDHLTQVGGTLFFVANDGIHGRELWKSDGTEAGTVLVKDILPGNSGSYPSNLTNVNGTLFFVAGAEAVAVAVASAGAEDGTGGRGLWKSDGTEAGTVLVKNIGPNGDDGHLDLLTNVDGVLFFVADNGTDGRELWKSDGTELGTVLVKDVNPGAGDGFPMSEGLSLINVQGTLFFTAKVDGTRELWKSDGTELGTVKIELDTPENGAVQPLFEPVNFNGTLFFGVGANAGETELWKSDGTADGTMRVKAMGQGGIQLGEHFASTVTGDTLFFSFDDGFGGSLGLELWKTDGTEAGTLLVKDIHPGSSPSYPIALTNVNNRLFFAANDGTHGFELWTSDGTETGTVMVKDILPGPDGSNAYFLSNFKGELFFAAAEDFNTWALWKVVSTVEAVTPPTIDPLGDRVIFEMGLILLVATATAPDGLVGQLEFALVEGPVSATIDPATGLFRWYPDEADGPGQFTVTISARDTGIVDSTTTTTFTLTVLEAGGRDTLGVFDPASSTFFLEHLLEPGPAHTVVNFGPPGNGWMPIVGDWDGDGSTTIGFFNGSAFLLKNDFRPGAAELVVLFSGAGSDWIPLAGDFNGDGFDTPALFDPVTSTFHIKNSLDDGGADLVVQFGPAGAGWLPVAGDFNGDGTTTIGLFEPANSFFFFRHSLTPGAADLVIHYGPAASGWVPVVGAFNGDGTATVGLYQQDGSFFLLRNSNTPGAADEIIGFGPTNVAWLPLVGDWAAPFETQELHVAGGPGPWDPALAVLQPSELTTVVDAALLLWAGAGLEGPSLGQLGAIDYLVTRLPAGQLGSSLPGTVVLDTNGAGHGWHVDPETDPEADRVDLLTVVLHKMGRELGLAQLDNGEPGLMHGLLPLGTRRLPAPEIVDEVLAMD